MNTDTPKNLYAYGIDPGIHGAVAQIEWDRDSQAVVNTYFVNLPYHDGLVYPYERVVLEMAPADRIVVIEEPIMAAGRPISAKSVRSTLTNFGRLTLWVERFLHADWVGVAPRTWKKELGLSRNKAESFAMAKELFGIDLDQKKYGNKQNREGLAEALLIAYYGLRVYN